MIHWGQFIVAVMDVNDGTFFTLVHCLHPALPPVKSNPYELRFRERHFELPVCRLKLRLLVSNRFLKVVRHILSLHFVSHCHVIY